MEGSPITRHRKKPRKIIDETIKKDLNFNGLTIDIIYTMTSSDLSS